MKERKAVIILTSQKYVFHTNLRILQSKIKILPLKINDFGATRTLPVAVTVISFLGQFLYKSDDSSIENDGFFP